MRLIIILLSLVYTTATTSCKSKKGATSTTSSSSTTTSSTSSTSSSSTSSTTEVGNNQGMYVGKVSHKYSAGGCSTVIVISGEAGDTVLIPKDKLAKDVDVDGQLIKFDYRALKMPQPAGCTTGIPAEITNINKMK
jgi:hypothetical protein